MGAQSRALRIPEILDLIFDCLLLTEEPKQPRTAGRTAKSRASESDMLLFATLLSDSDDASEGDTGVLHAGFHSLPIIAPRRRTLESLLSVPSNKSSLVAAAVSCRRFTPSALRTLWRNMDSTTPLISLLPVVIRDGQHLLAPNITPETWARFDMYRNFIRVLTIGHMGALWVKRDAIWTTILAKTTIPLPHLHTLIIQDIDTTLKLFSSFLLSPQLQRLELGKHLDKRSFASFCSFLHHATVNSIQSLKIDKEVNPADLKLITSRTLRVLRISLASRVPASQVFVDLPLLQCLHLQLASDVGPQPLQLPSLRSLHIGGPIESLTGFLSSCECDLESISIQLPKTWNLPDSPGDALKVLLSIVGKQWAHSLRHLKLDCSSSRRPSNDLWDNFSETIRPITNLPLVTLHFLDSPFRLGSKVSVLSVASRFPHVQSLVLPRSKSGKGLTFTELHELAVAFPSLQHLGASVNLQENAPRMPVLNHGLKTLDVLVSPVTGKMEDIALNLDRIFLSLTKITSSKATAQVTSKWEEVGRLLRLFRQARDR